jgi:hypothetical protein
MSRDIEAGARNLLLNCAGAKPGDSLLLIGEQAALPFFDSQLCEDVAEVARGLGIESKVLLARPVADASQFPAEVSAAMQSVDITVFFSRLGDQIRFSQSPGNSTKVMTYTLSREHLGSAFATVDYQMMQRIHDHLFAKIKGAKTYRIEAANGTSLSAELPGQADSGQPVASEFTVELFPVMIFPPITFFRLNGQLVLEHFLLSSSTRAYPDSVLHLDSAVTVEVEDSHMVGFDGDSHLITRLKSQLERAASLTGGDPFQLNSWHTGINPYTFYSGDLHANLEQWGTVTYGSPRYTHIHAAGNDPGDISIQLFDASISFDGKAFWDRGKFTYLDSPEVQSLLRAKELELFNSSILEDIGI